MGEFFRASFTDKLKVDQALLNITSSLEKSVWLYQLSDECVSVSHKVFPNAKNICLNISFTFQCPFKKVVKISAQSYVERKISTETQLKWSILTSNTGPYAFGNR